MTKYYLRDVDTGEKHELYLDDVSEEDIKHIVFVASSMLGFMDSLGVVKESDDEEPISD